MRVSSIQNCQPISASQCYSTWNCRKVSNLPKIQNVKPSFQGSVKWGGFLGSTVGALAGVGAGALLTLATGGVAAPLLLAGAGCFAGGIAGDAIDSKINPNYPKDDDYKNEYTPGDFYP